jgi:uncharacterized membrane protein YoaK (UPF0700 family)
MSFAPRAALDRLPRDALLVLLALATGVTDAAAFERLGHVFASVITGNLILLGIGLVKDDNHLLLFAGCALAGYSCGVLLAAPGRKREPPERSWPTGATAALAGEVVLLAAFAVGWELAGRAPTEAWQAILVVLAGGAMGVQSTAIRRLGGISTTYLTSTLTGLLEDLRSWRRSEGQLRSVGILLVAFGGAALAVVLIRHERALLPIFQLVPVVGVAVASRALPRED